MPLLGVLALQANPVSRSLREEYSFASHAIPSRSFAPRVRDVLVVPVGTLGQTDTAGLDHNRLT